MCSILCLVMFFSLSIMSALQADRSFDIKGRAEEIDNFVESPALIKCKEHGKLDHRKEQCLNPKNMTGSGYVGAMPHMVMISPEYLPFHEDDLERLCGGALISKNFVLTSGVCAFMVQIMLQQTRNVYVRLGEGRANSLKDVQEAENTTQAIPIARIFVHPKFRKLESSPYNIGLLQLKTPVLFSVSVRPACLQSGGNLESIPLIVSNWKRGTGDTHMLWAGRSEVRPFEDCLEGSHKNGKHSTFAEICIKSGSELCGGDVTNIVQMVTSEPHCSYHIVGINGIDRCRTNTVNHSQKTFFTRLALFIPWIEKIVWPKQITPA